MRHFWAAAADLDPRAVALDEGARFPLCRPDALRAALQTAGAQEVEVRAIDIATPFAGFDDYWAPFLGGQGPAPAYVLSLDDAARAALAAAVRARLPFDATGRLPLAARAWAVRAIRPALA